MMLGQVEWTRYSEENPNSTTGPGTATSHDIALDPVGNLVITGDCSGKSSFEDVIFPTSVYHSMFLTSYNEAGDLRWAKPVFGNSNNHAYAVATDNNGNVFMAGEYRQTNANTILDFGDITMTGVTSPSGFLAKADSNGTFLWSKSILSAPPADVVITDMQLDPAGNAYVFGTMEDTVLVDSLVYNQGNNGLMMFLAKYLPNGDLAWFKHSNTIDNPDYGSFISAHMQIGSEGQIYLNGGFFSFPIFNGYLGWDTDTIFNVLGGGQFLARFDLDGKLEWWRSMDGGSTQYPHEMGIDEQDNIYLTMQHGNQMQFTDATLDPNDFDGRLILLKYSPTGERLFTTDVAYGNVSSSGDIRNQSVTIHTRPNGTTFLSGLYGSNSSSFIVFGHQDTLPMPNNSNDGARQFLTSFDKDGNYIDVGVLVDEYIAAPTFFWENTAMVSNPEGDFYLTGKFAGQLRLDMDSLLAPGTGSANGQAFAVKFDPKGILDLSTTSVEDELAATSLKLYPNPAKEILNIELAEIPTNAPVHLRLFTLNGQLLMEQNFWGNQYQIRLDGLSPGLYLLDLQLADKRVSRRFIVE